jgi:cytochrome c553
MDRGPSVRRSGFAVPQPKGGAMKISSISIFALAFVVSVATMFAADPPPWAYGFIGPPQAGATPVPVGPANTDQTPRSIPGATTQYARAQIANRFGPADWFPSEHPQMPDVVAHGKQPNVWACGLCHYPNGKGRAENAGVNGLSVEYFIHTMNDFKNGNRKSADPRKANTNLMIQFAKNMSDDEIKATAEYFGSMKWTPWIKVVEAKMAPKTKPKNGLFLVEGTEMEPLGNRIVETPVNAEATEILRDPHSGFTAYVPVGAVKKGEALVTKGGGKTIACGGCHGADLKGLGPVPGLAGRSPSYLMRQMFDTQQGFRKGTWTELMKPVVANLTTDDMMNIVAYTASQMP